MSKLIPKISRQRKTKLSSLGINGIPAFTELILLSDEKKNLEKAKSLLAGKSVCFSPESINRTNHSGTITDIRIVVTGMKEIHSCAIVYFPSQGYSRLRSLDDLIGTKGEGMNDE